MMQNRFERWEQHFLGMALHCARMSKDPNTKVGAVLVSPDRMVRSTGYNGFPRDIADRLDRLQDKQLKLQLVVHAEMNAIMNAARTGVSTRGCRLYVACTDDTGMVWGGPPCTRCAVHVIQAGIVSIVAYPMKAVSSWLEDLKQAHSLLSEARVQFKEVLPPPPKAWVG